MRPALLAPALLLLGLLPTAASARPEPSTNTSRHITLRVKLVDGRTVDGQVHLLSKEIEVRGARTRRFPYHLVASLGMVPRPTRAQLVKEYAARAGSVPKGDARAWAHLGRWAREHHLDEQATDAFQRALKLDPTSVMAHHGLGQVKRGGKWVDGVLLLAKRRRSMKTIDPKALVVLAKDALGYGLDGTAFRYLREALLRDNYYRRGLTLIHPFTSAYQQVTVPLHFPLHGRWHASTDPTRHHQKKVFACYALDLMKVDTEGRAYRNSGRRCSDYFGYKQPIYSMAPGTVVEIRDGFPDNAIGDIGDRAGKHNGIAIDVGHGEYIWYIHCTKGSFKVKRGDHVEAGQELAEVGNSGGSAVPHLHVTLVSYRGISVPWYCDDYEVIAPDGTPLRVTRAWPHEGWTIEYRPKPKPPRADRTTTRAGGSQ